MPTPQTDLQQTLQRAGPLGLIIQFALSRPVTVAMMALSLSLIGVIAYTRIPLQLMPSGYTFPLLYIQVVWPNATPAEGEQQVLEPLEGAVATVPGVRHLHSYSRVGSLGMRIEFDDSTNMDDAYNNLRERLDRLRGDLPEGIQNFYIWKFDPNDDPVVAIGLLSPEGVSDPFERIQERLVRRVDRQPGVGSVEIWGGVPQVVQVEVDPGKTRALGLSAYEVAEKVRAAGFVIAAGRVTDGGRVLPLRVARPLQDLETVRRIALGRGLMLRDVAEVELIHDNTRGSVTRIDGRPALVMAVFKESRANTVATCSAVWSELQLALEEDPSLAGFALEKLFDQGEIIGQSIGNLESALLGGGAIALVLLFIFLGHFRLTFVAATAIPASLLCSVAVLYLMGRSLNVLSLMGLMLSVGMVVDNSIVVVERIARCRAQGQSARRAAGTGTLEVALAITVATGTTVVAFVPIILMTGNRGLSFFLGELGLPVCLALVASLLLAVIVVPLLSQSGRVVQQQRWPFLQRFSEYLLNVYQKLLALAVRHPLDTTLLAAAILASVFWVNLPITDRLEGGLNDVIILLRSPPNYTLEDRQRILAEIERSLLQRQQELEIDHVISRLRRDRGRDSIRAFLTPVDDRKLSHTEITKRIRKMVDPGPGVRWRIGWGGMGAGEGKKLSLRIRGPDSEVLRELADEVVARMERVPGILTVEADAESDSVRELRAQLQPELALRQGISPALLGGSLSLALRGWTVGKMFLGYRKADILVRVANARQQGIGGVAQLTLPTQTAQVDTSASAQALLSGQAVEQNLETMAQAAGQTSLGAVTEFEDAPGFGAIYRNDRQTVVQVAATMSSQDLVGMRNAVQKQLAQVALPRDYSIDFGSRFEELEGLQNDEFFAVILATAFVFLFMGILFESWLLPLAVLASLPFAYTGSKLALAITGTPRDVMAMVGMVILIGIVVNNAIVLVDAINRLRRAGVDRQQAILTAGRERLRPIVMTALTTVGGLLPLALGAAQIAGVSYAPLARTVIGGLVTSTVVTLLLVPTAYVLLDDLGGLLMKTLLRALVRGK